MQFPPDLERDLNTFVTNAVANTVNAGLACLAAPPAPPSSRYRLWGVILSINHSTSAPAAAAFVRVVVRDSGGTALCVLSTNTNAPHSEIYFPGGLRLGDNLGVDIDNNASAVSQAISVLLLYTVERV